MYNEEIKKITTDITGAVTIKEVGKIYNKMLSMRKPKYGCMVDLSDLPTDAYGRIQWKKSIGKQIVVAYEEVYATFTITGTSKCSGCHDTNITLTDGSGTYKTVLASTIKDKRLGRLFNRYIKYYYRLKEGDALKIGSISDEKSPVIKIKYRTVHHDKNGVGHKAYVTECTHCAKTRIIEEYDLLTATHLCNCKKAGMIVSKVS